MQAHAQRFIRFTHVAFKIVTGMELVTSLGLSVGSITWQPLVWMRCG